MKGSTMFGGISVSKIAKREKPSTVAFPSCEARTPISPGRNSSKITMPMIAAAMEVRRYVATTVLPLRPNSEKPSKRNMEQVMETNTAGAVMHISAEINRLSTGLSRLVLIHCTASSGNI